MAAPDIVSIESLDYLPSVRRCDRVRRAAGSETPRAYIPPQSKSHTVCASTGAQAAVLLCWGAASRSWGGDVGGE